MTPANRGVWTVPPLQGAPLDIAATLLGGTFPAQLRGSTSRYQSYA
jgi:hypothetical protein